MGDPHGPWQEYGQQADAAHPRQPSSGRDAVRPYVPPLEHEADEDAGPVPGNWGQGGRSEDVTDRSDPSGTAWNQRDPNPGDRAPADMVTPEALDRSGLGYGNDPGPRHRRQGDPGPDDIGEYDADDRRGWSLRSLIDELVWRYRSAPLWARVVTDVAVASLVLGLIVGVSLVVRSDDRPRLAANRSTTTASTTSSTIPTTTTTTVPPTTTTAPTTTTTVPTTTTTARPAVPPPTDPPPPPTDPPTTTTRVVHYRDCTEAFLAGALPLFAGEPGYAPYLDRDGDGEACEPDDRRGR